MLISLLAPTRGRPRCLKRLINSIASTTKDLNSVELVLRVDEDDKETIAVARKYSSKCVFRVVPVIGGRDRVLSNLWNECWKAAKGEIYMMCADDIVFETKHWDDVVTEEFGAIPDRILMVWGDDKHKAEKLATHGFIHKNWTDVLGYYVPPLFKCHHNDSWLYSLGVRVGRVKYRKDMVIRHVHWRRGHAPFDTTYKQQMKYRGESREVWKATKKQRSADAKKLKQFIKVFAAAKTGPDYEEYSSNIALQP